MRRLFNVLREWLQLRSRVRGEYRYHLDCAIADLRSLGVSPRAAKRAAKNRLGRARHRRRALREIGGNAAALPHLFHVHRVTAEPWWHPALLVAFAIGILLASPSPLLLIESLIGMPITRESATTVFVSAPAPWPVFTGLSPREFEALRAMPELSGVERYRNIYARAVSRGPAPSVIESKARVLTGNPALGVVSQFEERRIEMGPAFIVWIGLAITAVFSLHSAAGNRTWLIFSALTGCAHVLTSLVAWAFATEVWRVTLGRDSATSGVSFGVLLVIWLLSAALQYRGWLRDIRRRCPVCLESLLLSWTRGATGDMLLDLPVTESVCARGHGVLTESRWTREFRREQSSLEAVIQV
jgi:hypothetical protein